MMGGRVLRKRKQAESGCVAPHMQAFCTLWPTSLCTYPQTRHMQPDGPQLEAGLSQLHNLSNPPS